LRLISVHRSTEDYARDTRKELRRRLIRSDLGELTLEAIKLL
jgi:hypothetical protein